MIDFNVDSIHATSDRFAELSRSADRQHADADSAYSSIKSAVLEKIRCIEGDIRTAESELQQVSDTRAHNQEVERRERERMRVAKEKQEKLKSEKEKAEGKLRSAKRRLSAVRMMTDGSSNAVSQLESKISELESDISDLESDIGDQQDIIDAAEKKLEEIEQANRKLDQIEAAIRRSIGQMRTALQQLKSLKEQMMHCKEVYDGQYGQTKRGMQAVHERTVKALQVGRRALDCFNAAGCGSSKSVCVDSPALIANISAEIDRAATHVSSVAFEMQSEADRYGSRLRDRISSQVMEEAKRAKAQCEEKNREWAQIALNLKNAYYELTFYQECKM